MLPAAASVLADVNSAISASWTTTYTRLAPYLGTPKFAIATFILRQYSTKQTLIVGHQHGDFYYKNSREQLQLFQLGKSSSCRSNVH